MNHTLRQTPGFAPGMIASRVAVVAGMVACVIALVFLTPSRHQLFKRHLADGDERAASLLLAAGNEGNSDEITTALTAETIRMCEREGWEKSSLNMLTSFLRRNRNFAAAADEALRHVDRVPSAVRGEILAALVTRSLGDGDLKRAQELQVQLVESADVLTPEIVRQAIKTYRYNGNPALALVTIDRLEKERGSLAEDLRELRVVLARETSQPAIAFALLDQQIRSTDDPDALRALIPRAVKTGIEAGRQNDLVPLYEKYLAILKGSGESADPRIAEYSMKLAQTYEWTKQGSKAFDVYVELAALGNREALVRCRALNPGLFRQEDLMKALVAGYQHYREDDELLLLTARYLGEAALREDAIRFYQEYLERNPDDAEAHYRLAAVYDEGVQLESALKHFKRAYELNPSNNAYLAKVARLSTTVRDYDEALVFLAELGKRTRTRDHVEQYYTLASGLGDMAATKDSLRLLIDIGGRLAPSNYIYLASAYRDEGDLSGHLAVLKEGLAKYPRNAFIRLDLANAHLYEKRPDRALQVLAEVKITQFPQAVQVALNALTTLDKTPYARLADGALRRYGSQLETSEDLTPVEVLQLGEFCREHNDTARARRLFQRVLDEGSEPGHLARAHYHLGQYRSARGHQIKHIAAWRGSDLLTSADYQLLGDIHTKLGESSEARAAYRTALSLLKKTTAKSQNR